MKQEIGGSRPLAHPIMKNKNMTENGNQKLSQEPRRIFERELFGGERLVDFISRKSVVDAQARVDEINRGINLSTIQVINSCVNKLKSWKIGGGQLDHTMLLVI